MKKTRLISMLLSAALIVSSLPFAATTAVTAASPTTGIELGTDLLDGVDFTADVNTLDSTAEAGNGYLHLDNYTRPTAYWAAGVGYQPDYTFEAGTAYYLALDVRYAFGSIAKNEVYDTSNNAVNYSMSHSPRTDMTLTDIMVHGTLSDGSVNEKFLSDIPTPSSLIDDTAVTTYSIVKGTTKGGWSGNGHYNLTVTPNINTSTYIYPWTHFETVFVPAEDEVDPIIAFMSNPPRASIPMDIDNFEIYTYVDGAKTPIVTYNFTNADSASLCASAGGSTVGKFFPAKATGTAASAVADFTVGGVKIEQGTEYTKLLAPTGAATVNYSLGDGIALDVGEYTLSGEARLNFYSNAYTGDPEDNKGSLTASVTAGETVSKTLDISHEWTAFDGITLTVTEDTDLTAVTLTFTDPTRAATSANKTIDMRNVSLIKTKTNSTASSMLDGASAKTDTSYEVVDVEDGNKFLHINNRIYHYISGSGVYTTLASTGAAYMYAATDDTDGTYYSDTVYYFGFDARMSVEGVSTEDGYDAETASILHYATTQFGIDTAITDKTDGSSFTVRVMTPTDKLTSDYTSSEYSGNKAKTYWKNGYYAVELTPEWTYCEFAFKPSEDVVNSGTSIKTYIGFSNVSGYHNAVPIDIDNAKIWYYKDGATEPTYITNDTFDTGSDNSYFTNGSNFEKRSNNFCNAAGAGGHTYASTLSIIGEYDYEKIAADDGKAKITYTLSLEPGLYSFTGNARLDYHNPGGEQAEQLYLDYNDLPGAKVETAKVDHKTYVAGEDNMASLTVTASAGGETASSSTDITTEWGSAGNVSFLVPPGAATREVSITVTMKDETTAANMALDLRDLDVTLTTPIDELYDTVEQSFFNGAPAVSTAPYELVDVEDGNKFIHVSERAYSYIGSSGIPTTNLASGIGYQYNDTYYSGTMYYIGFDARMSVEGVSTEDGYDAETASMLHTMGSVFNLTDTLAGEDGSTAFTNTYMTPTDKLDSAYVSDEYLGNEGATVWKNGYYAVELTPDWTYYEFAFMPASDVEYSGNSTHIGFSKLPGSHHSSVPIDIDNAKIWYYEEGATEPTYITDDDFDGTDDYLGTPYSTSGRSNNFFSVSGAGGYTHSCYFELSSEYDYEKIGAQGGEASITYTFDLAPGLYTVAGEARLDYHNPAGTQAEYAKFGQLHTNGVTYGGNQHATYVEGEDNMADLTITVASGDKAFESTTEIITEWCSAGGLSFTVPEGSESNEVTVTFTMNDKTSAANMALDLRSLALNSLGSLKSCELGDGMLADAEALSTADISKVTGADKYNQYLHLYDRSTSSVNSGIGFCSVTEYAANTLYYISFDARVSLPTVSISDGFTSDDVEVRQAVGAMFDVKDIQIEGVEGASHSSRYLIPTDKLDSSTGTYKASENAANTVWNDGGFYEVVLTEDWTTCEFAFIPVTKAVRRETGLSIFTSDDLNDSVPIDIDNVQIFRYDNTTGTRTYIDTFDFENGILDIDFVMTTDILGHFYVANGVNGNSKGIGAISVEHECNYDRISLSDTAGAVVTYDFGGMTLDPGVYALDGIVRQDYYNPAGMDHKTSISGEDNTVALSASAIVDGKEIRAFTTVTEEWTELSRLLITVPAGAEGKLESITLTFADSTESYNNGIAVKELALTQISAAYDTNDAEWTSKAGAAINCFPILDKTETYIEITDRAHYLDRIKYVNEDITLIPDETYTLTLWARGIPDSSGDCGMLGVYINYPLSSRKLSSTWGADHYKGDNDIETGNLILHPEWQEHKMVFVARDEAFSLLIEGKRSADHSRIIDIAGLSLTASDELGNPIGEELIKVWNTEYSDGIGWIAAPYSDETDISFAIIDDYVYKTAEVGDLGASLTYDTDETFETGTYTVSGRVRLGTRKDSYVDYALRKFTVSKWLFLVHNDSNRAGLTLTVNGTEADSVSLTNLWKDIELTFTLDEACVPDITLALDDTFALDFADLTITAENN